MKKLLCALLIFIWSATIFSLPIKNNYALEIPQYNVGTIAKALTSKKASRSINANTAIELTGGINGTLETGDLQIYFVSLDAHQVLDFYIGFLNQSSYASIYVYMQGSTDYWAFFSDTSDSISHPLTLAHHCPEYPTKYYFDLQVQGSTNFTFYVNKRDSAQISSTTFSGTVHFQDSGNIGIPIATQCQQLVLDLTLSVAVDPSSISLNFMCRDYDSKCSAAGVALQYIFQAGTDSATHYQFLINCTAVGTYYLNMPTASLTTYNATLHTGYPCPSGCWQGGICDLQKGTCLCNAGFQGASCTVNQNSVNYTEIAFTAGSTYTLTAVTQQKENAMLKLEFTPSASQVIRISFFVAVSNSINFLIYYNLQANATTSNYLGYTELSVFGDSITREVQLCASNGPWYIYIVPFTYHDVIITTTLVNMNSVSTDFSANVPTSANSYTPTVFMFKPPGTTAIVQVNETNPLLYGVYIFTQCAIFQDPALSQSPAALASDVTYGFGKYQVTAVNLKTSQNYYVMVLATPSANFTGTITYANPGKCASCSGNLHGFCAPASYCICRNGYTGTNCSEVEFPKGDTQLQSQQLYTLQLPSGSFYNTIIYAIPPVVPAKNSIILAASSNTDVTVFIDTYFPVASQLDAGSFLISHDGGVQYYTFGQCIGRDPTQYYFALAPQNQVGGLVNVTVTIENGELPNDGTPTQVNFIDGETPFTSTLPAACSEAYLITVTGPVDSVYVGEGSDFCFSESGAYMSKISSSNFSYTLPIKNCSDAIDLIITADSLGSATVTITSTTPCPNGCSGHGQCLSGGVCLCSYPFVGSDCGSYDVMCTVLPDSGICASSIPSSFPQYFSDPAAFCSLQYSSYQVSQDLADLVYNMGRTNILLSTDCKNEMQQILCDDVKYKCQNQPGGGVKLLLPCNSATWLQRCAPSYTSPLAYLQNAITNVKNNMQTYPGVYICNPNPFNATTTSSSTTSSPTSSSPTSSSPTSSLPTSSTSSFSSATSSPSSFSPTSTSTSLGYRLLPCGVLLIGILISINL